MTRANATRDKLLTEGRRLLWSRGYSNVSLREIARAAGVDVALIARYFGNKLGLFEATIENAFDTPDLPDEAALIEATFQMFADAPRDGKTPSVLHLIQNNASDPEVGALVRQRHAEAMQAKVCDLLGDPERAALFTSAVLGFAMAERTLALDGIAPPGSPGFARQLRHLMESALAYRPD